MKNIYLVLIVALIALAGATSSMADESVSFAVTPKNIQIDTTYNGATLKVVGEAPAGSDVVLRMTGVPTDMHMKRKEKVLGLLWMNMDEVNFEGVPVIYLLDSTKPLGELGPAGRMLEPENDLSDIAIEPETKIRPELINQLITLKQREELFQNAAGTLEMGPESGGMQAFEGTMKVPSRLPPGEYTMEAFAVQDGAVVASSKQNIGVELVSVPKLMSKLAFGHGAMYGVLATIIAILSGLLVGMIFKSKGGAH